MSKKTGKNASFTKTCTIGEFADIVGISLRSAQRLGQEGVITSIGTENRSNIYDISASVQSYINHIKTKAEDKNGKGQIEKLKEEKLGAEINLKRSQAELHELQTDIKKGEFIKVEEVKVDYQRFFTIFKKFAIAIPARVGGRLTGYVEPVVSRGIENDLQREVNEMLRNFTVNGVSPEDIGE